MKSVFGVALICVLIVLVIIWLKLQEEPAPIIIALTFTGALVGLTVRFGLKAPLMIFGAAVGAFVVFFIAPSNFVITCAYWANEIQEKRKKGKSNYLPVI